MAERVTTKRTAGRGILWAWTPVILFAVQGVVLGATVMLATGRGLHAVEPDYYARSLRWDEHAETLRAADRLGWSTMTQVASLSDEAGEREIRVTIVNAEGGPIAGASVSAEAFHHAYAGDRATVVLAESDRAGVYVGHAPLGRRGLWEVRTHIERGEDECLTIQTIELGG